MKKRASGQALFLGYGPTETDLFQFVINQGFSVAHETEPLVESDSKEFDLIISYGYRHKISEQFLDSVTGPKINLHISLLPWNKGAHPIFWAYYDGTPSGVTIHELAPGIDCGPVYAQQSLQLDPNLNTFTTAYNYHRSELEKLFISVFPDIYSGNLKPKPQEGLGSYHRSSDLPRSFKGWNSQIGEEIERLKKVV
jgi:methionyl-tRNA formyltransferase